MVLGKLSSAGGGGVLLVWIVVGQVPTALAVGRNGGFFGRFYSNLSFLFFLPF